MPEHPRPHPDLAGYVLGVLTDKEAAAFEGHLADCADCRDEVASLAGLPSLLEGAPPPVVPPPTLRGRTLAAVERAASARRRRRIATVGGAVAALAAAVVAVVVLTRPAAPAFEIQLAGAQDAEGVAYVRRVPAGVQIDLQLRNLPPAPAGSYFECWYVAPGDQPDRPQRVSGGTFSAPEGGDVRVMMFTAADPRTYPLMDVTLEPPDGDPARSGPVVVTSAPE